MKKSFTTTYNDENELQLMQELDGGGDEIQVTEKSTSFPVVGDLVILDIENTMAQSLTVVRKKGFFFFFSRMKNNFCSP